MKKKIAELVSNFFLGQLMNPVLSLPLAKGGNQIQPLITSLSLDYYLY